MLGDLDGGVAVVTGAAHGIGLALATRFATENMSVVLADLDGAALDVEVEKLRSRGVNALSVVADVADYASVVRLRDAATERFGPVSILCNNAGMNTGQGLCDHIELDDWHRTVNVDLFGVIHGIKAFLPSMLERDRGHIVNTASRLGFVQIPGLGAYCAAKAGALSLSESLRDELAVRGSSVGITVLCPGPVRTPQLMSTMADESLDRQTFEELTRRLANMVEPEQVADLVVRSVHSGSFYVFTHSSTLDLMESRDRAVRGDLKVVAPPI